MSAMRDISLVMAYYENPNTLRHQYARIRELPQVVRDNLEVVIVDDGSPPPGEAFYEEIGCPLHVYRIEVDVRWNQDAARNVGVHHSSHSWILMTDMDHEVPENTWQAVMRQKLDPRVAYQFARVSAPSMTAYKKHPNSYLMTRAMFEATGGYDERFAGYYGTDSDYKHRVARCATMLIDLKEPLVRYPREVIPDASTVRYDRKAPQDKSIKGIRSARNETPGWMPLRLTFPYHRVAR
jgi:glycosyltransferase involved in cell wall biosynthesis